jgi:arginyl-tRNA synthetase
LKLFKILRSAGAFITYDGDYRSVGLKLKMPIVLTRHGETQIYGAGDVAEARRKLGDGAYNDRTFASRTKMALREAIFARLDQFEPLIRHINSQR